MAIGLLLSGSMSFAMNPNIEQLEKAMENLTPEEQARVISQKMAMMTRSAQLLNDSIQALDIAWKDCETQNKGYSSGECEQIRKYYDSMKIELISFMSNVIGK